jgi:hypothetical protein
MDAMGRRDVSELAAEGLWDPQAQSSEQITPIADIFL